jgi:hypothetical protein
LPAGFAAEVLLSPTFVALAASDPSPATLALLAVAVAIVPTST